MKISNLKKTVRIPGIDQIKSKLKEKKSETDHHDDELELEEVFEESALKDAWNAYLQNIKQQGKETEYAALHREISIVNDYEIHLKVPNSFQLLTIENIQVELLTHLRKKLKNKNITLKVDVEKMEDKKMIYTNSEKFEYLAAKYPALRTLKSRLDLETDF